MANATVAPEGHRSTHQRGFLVGDPYPTSSAPGPTTPVLPAPAGADARRAGVLGAHQARRRRLRVEAPALFRSVTVLCFTDRTSTPCRRRAQQIEHRADGRPQTPVDRSRCQQGVSHRLHQTSRARHQAGHHGHPRQVEDRAKAGARSTSLTMWRATSGCCRRRHARRPSEDYHLVKHWADTHADSGAESRPGLRATSERPDAAETRSDGRSTS